MMLHFLLSTLSFACKWIYFGCALAVLGIHINHLLPNPLAEYIVLFIQENHFNQIFTMIVLGLFFRGLHLYIEQKLDRRNPYA